MTQNILTLQSQTDSLATLALQNQNQQEEELLRVERGGLVLFFREKCCFYVNQSDIMKDKIR